MANQIPLEVLQIPTPCPADWDAMAGDQQVRFCTHCSLQVFNLSAMDRRSAERLMAEQAGELCVRLLKESDGTVVTADPGGWRSSIKKLRVRGGAIAAAMVAVVAGLIGVDKQAVAEPAATTPTFRESLMGGPRYPGPTTAPVTQPTVAPLMGAIRPPSTQPTTPPADGTN